MVNRLRLKWTRHLKGYEIVHFEPQLVDWSSSEKDGGRKAEFGRLPPPMPYIKPDNKDDARNLDEQRLATYQVVQPIGNKTEEICPVRKSQNLYLEFANTACSVEGIIKFATEYGLLGIGYPFETVDAWTHHIKRMRQAISKWEHVQGDKPETFAKTYRSLNPNPDDTLKLSLQIGSSGSLEQYLEPPNLLGAMWVQLAGAVEGATSFTPCAECSVWIDTAPGSNRPDKAYCSPACRQRAYRKRIARKAKK